ncbi:MAG: cyclic nucleotide-binding domain-containing protein [Acidobacteriota bacterium]
MLPPSTPTDAQKLLSRVSLFEGLSVDELAELSRSFRRSSFDAHERIYSCGEPAGHFFVIEEGEVALFKDQVGKPVLLQARLGQGEYFGEIGLFGSELRSSSARTSVPTRLLSIGKRALLEFLDEHPALAIKIQISAARRHSENASAALDLGLRKEIRIRLERKICLETPLGAHEAMLANLSFGGLCVHGAPAAWRAGGEVRFTLAYGPESLPVSARISWQEEDSMGLAFTERGTDHEERIQRLLRLLLEGSRGSR